MATASPSDTDKIKRDDPDLEVVYAESRARALNFGDLITFPWWQVVLGAGAILIAIAIAADPVYAGIYEKLKSGIRMTLGVSFASYFIALIIALLVGLIRSNPPQAPQTQPALGRVLMTTLKTIIYHIATLYVQIMRGLPILLVLLVMAFVIVPAIREPVQNSVNTTIVPALRNLLGNPEIADMDWKGSSPPSAIIALAFTYGAYMSETVRAGIQSIPKGQMEASLSVGMTSYQTMRYIILPQAIRNVLPPLGNDLVAMIKDSSLVSQLGIRDITQEAKVAAGASFRYVETYSVAAVLYLMLTITGSTLVRALEDTLREDRETPPWVKEFQAVWSMIRGKNIAKLKRGDAKVRGIYLMGFLVIILVVNILGLVLLFPVNRTLYGELASNSTAWLATILLQVIVILSAIGTLLWKRWGYAALIVTMLLSILLAVPDFNLIRIIVSIAGVRLLVYLTRNKIGWFE